MIPSHGVVRRLEHDLWGRILKYMEDQIWP